MSLITPDFGLIVWMTLIFGIVFFILAKFGFPVITSSVEKRAERIEKSLNDAREAEMLIKNLSEEQDRLIEKARKERSDMLKAASETRAQLIEEARSDAKAEADRLIAHARTEIAAEKEAAMHEVRDEVARLSVQIAEKIVRKELEGDSAQKLYIDTLLKEISSRPGNERTDS